MKIVHNVSDSKWEEYKNLRIEALTEAPFAFIDDPVTAKNDSEDEWKRKLKNMYFAELDGKWVGMIGAYQDERPKIKHILNLVSFYVLSSYRGLGIGKELLKEALRQAKNNPTIKTVQLGVVTTQKPALSLYKSLGFKKVGQLKYAVQVDGKYFDEYLMELYL